MYFNSKNMYLCAQCNHGRSFLQVENSLGGVKPSPKQTLKLRRATFRNGGFHFGLFAGLVSPLSRIKNAEWHTRTKGSAPCNGSNVTMYFGVQEIKIPIKGKEWLICIQLILKSLRSNSLKFNTTFPPHETWIPNFIRCSKRFGKVNILNVLHLFNLLPMKVTFITVIPINTY